MRTRTHAAPAASWSSLPDGDIGALYDAARGGPLSSTPLVHMLVPSYRESYEIAKRTEPSRIAVIDDLLSHGVGVMRTDVDGDSLIQRMRIGAMHTFLLSSATHLLWADVDLEARDPSCVRKMLASGHDVVGGAYPFKASGGRVTVALWPEDQDAMRAGRSLDLPHGCLEVRDVGTGFCLVSRAAIVALCRAHPELLHWSPSGEPLWAIYNSGVVNGSFLGEDYMFCHHWQQLGGKVYAHLPSTFRHYGTFGFEGSIMQQLGLAVAS